MNELKELSKDLNLSIDDIADFAKSIIYHMRSEGAFDTFVNAYKNNDKESVSKFLEAYAEKAIEKMNKISMKYKTSPKFKQAFQLYMLDLLKK